MKVIKIDRKQEIICCNCEKKSDYLFETRKPYTENKTHFMPYCNECSKIFSKDIWKR